MRPVYRGYLPARETERGPQYIFVVKEYGFYRKALIQRIGAYCSFCEVPMGANLAIEHIVAKKYRADLQENWDNFVLACVNCNSTKGTKVADTDDLPDYYWPTDTTIQGLDFFGLFTYGKSGTHGDDNVYVSPANPRDQRAIDTIALTQLNRVRVADPKVSDRRVFNRTATWNRASTMATTLAGYYAALGAAANADPAVIMYKRQIKMAAISSGFWSVWVTVFNQQTFVDDDTRNALICELFVQAFPGTNYPISPATGCGDIVPPGYSGGLPT
jgi:hypothetical protein